MCKGYAYLSHTLETNPSAHHMAALFMTGVRGPELDAEAKNKQDIEGLVTFVAVRLVPWLYADRDTPAARPFLVHLAQEAKYGGHERALYKPEELKAMEAYEPTEEEIRAALLLERKFLEGKIREQTHWFDITKGAKGKDPMIEAFKAYLNLGKDVHTNQVRMTLRETENLATANFFARMLLYEKSAKQIVFGFGGQWGEWERTARSKGKHA